MIVHALMRNISGKWYIVILTSFCLSCLYAQQNTEFKITASDGSNSDEFGKAVVIHEGYAIVGSPSDDDNGSASGSVYLFKKDGNNWIETCKIIASNGSSQANFGRSVSIYEEYALVGAWQQTDTNNVAKGFAYFFKLEQDTLKEVAAITASDGDQGDRFGFSVSIYEDKAIVGAPYDDDNGATSGSVYIFQQNGENWIELAKLTASDGEAGDYFGNIVAIDGDYIIVGAEGNDDNGSSTGSAYIFKWNGAEWVEIKKLLGSDSNGQDYFGSSVSINNEHAIVGAWGDNENGIHSGSAYIFSRDNDNWTETVKLIPSDGAGSDQFGRFSVSIVGDYAAVGAEGDDDSGGSAGAAYIFHWNGTNWNEQVKLKASDGAFNDVYGQAIAMDNSHIIIGSHHDDDNGTDSGSAYIYEINSGTAINDKQVSYFPSNVDLAQNYPNPFNPTTKISFYLPKSTGVILSVYNILGKQVDTLIEERKLAGKHEIIFDATNLPGGLYFYHMKTETQSITKKMLYVK